MGILNDFTKKRAQMFQRQQPDDSKLSQEEFVGWFLQYAEMLKDAGWTKEDFIRILKEPQNALITQYTALLATEGIDLEIKDSAIHEIARIASEVNERMENIGARRLHTVMEKLLDEISFDAPDMEMKSIVIDKNYVLEKLKDIVEDQNLSRYIL